MSVRWPSGAREFLDRARIGRLATSDAAQQPHVVPICFALVGDRVYSVIDAKPKRDPRNLKRLRNIAENPRVAFLVDHYEDDWAQLAWVLVRGRCGLVDDSREYEVALEALRHRYEQYRAMPLLADSNPMLCLEIERVTTWAHGPVDS